MVSPLVAQAILSNKGPDVVGSFQRGREEARQGEIKRLSSQALKGEEGAFDALQGIAPEVALMLGEKIGAGSARDLNSFIKDAVYAERMLAGGNNQGALTFVSNRLSDIKRRGGDARQTQRIYDLLSTGQNDLALQELGDFGESIDSAKNMTAEMRNREMLLRDLKSEDKNVRESAEIALAIRGRPGQVIDTKARGELKQSEAEGSVRGKVVAEADTAETAASTAATIAEAKKFGELTGSSRAKAIDAGIGNISRIDTAIGNLDDAIIAVQGGAGTGALQRYMPSFKASSVALDQIQNKLALDVISGVTLGAISEAELALAKEVALPKGLDGPELVAHLEKRKAAQQKLRAYFGEQIEWLDKGGTIAGFVREMERKNKQSNSPTPQPSPAQSEIVEVNF